MLKFSKANAKTQALANDAELADYLTDKRKIYSLDLLVATHALTQSNAYLRQSCRTMASVKSKTASIQNSVAFQRHKKYNIPTCTIHASTILTYCVNYHVVKW